MNDRFFPGVFLGVFVLLVSGVLFNWWGESIAEINAEEFKSLQSYCDKNGGVHHVLYSTSENWNDFERPVTVICNDGAEFVVPKEWHNKNNRYSKPSV